MNNQGIQELPRSQSDATALKTNVGHHVSPCLAQQLYQPMLSQPPKNYELVKEMKLHPRSKASPRAATFLKVTPRSEAVTRVSNQPAENSGVSFSKMNSYLSSVAVVHASTSDETFDIVSVEQKPQSSPHLSHVDIRFAFLPPKF